MAASPTASPTASPSCLVFMTKAWRWPQAYRVYLSSSSHHLGERSACSSVLDFPCKLQITRFVCYSSITALSVFYLYVCQRNTKLKKKSTHPWLLLVRLCTEHFRQKPFMSDDAGVTTCPSLWPGNEYSVCVCVCYESVCDCERIRNTLRTKPSAGLEENSKPSKV